MKSLKTHINESHSNTSFEDNYLNEDADIIIEVLPILVKNIGGLEALIKKRLGISIKLTATLGRRKDNIVITSGNLASETGKLGKTIFSEIRVSTWGGKLSSKEPYVWINPKLEYTHPGNGSNGTNFIWDSIWFDFENERWIEGNIIF